MNKLTVERLEDRCTPSVGVDVYTFFDNNRNGMWDPGLGEYGVLGMLNGVTVDNGVSFQAYQQTVPTGFYTQAGNWYLGVPQPGLVQALAVPLEGYELTTPGVVAFPNLQHGEVGLAFFGIAPALPPPAQVDVVAFWDYNVDGIWQPEDGETGIEGLLVGLAAEDGSYQAFLTTSNEGVNWFTGVPSGKRVWASVTVPPDLVPTTPTAQPFTLAPNEVGIAYFGFTVFFDTFP